MGFTTLGLSDQVLKGVASAGYTVPTPIQSLAVQPALEGKDIIGCAQTGTGKTAAFVLPILDLLLHNEDRKHPRALIVTPTRELARQVEDTLKVYGRFTGLRSVSIYGGVGMEPQLNALRKGVDIIVATPGRLLDHLKRGSADLSHIRIVVLDEADRMLDMGFIHDMTKILSKLPADRQTLLFSATVSEEIRKIAGKFMRNPETIRVGESRNPVETVTQFFYGVQREYKPGLLVHVLEAEKMERVLVFSRTKHGADKIVKRLQQTGIASAAIHANRSQGQRQKALDGFIGGRYRVLVATNIAARGIDVDGISHVINYDLPNDAEDYIHRIGRTGRAGATGDAVTFVGHEDRPLIRNIESFTGKRITIAAYPEFRGEAHTDAYRSASAPGAQPAQGGTATARPQHRTTQATNRAGRGSSFNGRRGRPGRNKRRAA